MRNERGFVSLLTTIMLSLLLLVITLSLVSLEALQLRKSEDSEQTLRAYYAAEAGIEEGAAKVLSGLVTATTTPPQTDCNLPAAKNPNYDATGAAGWTCQMITFSGAPTGILKDPDAAKTIDPLSAVYDSVVIEWNQSNVTDFLRYSVPLGTLPPAVGYGYYAAPPMEVAIVQYPIANFAASDPNLKLSNALIVPHGAAGGVIPYSTISSSSLRYNGNCAPGDTRFGIAGGLIAASHYNCWAQIKGLGGAGLYHYLFRLRSRYMPTSYKVTFFSSGGAQVSVPDGTATIDVTAKAGQTYRRVISKLPINGGAASGLNYVMYSDTDICKNFDVMHNLPHTPSVCPY